MLFAVLSGFLLAIVAPWIHRLAPRLSGWLFGLLPAALFLFFLGMLPRVGAEPLLFHYSWVPSLGVDLSFRVDGLALLFALVITGVGTMVIIYAGGYLAGHPLLGRFYLYILMFMASMLGVVLSDNVLSLFIFWELTSLSSYFLIGWDHERAAARRSALMALLVTGGGGLAMMAGLVMLALAGGSWELTELLAKGDLFRQHPWYSAMLALILAGTFTKSAQFPFHFWLPCAMEAPAPVSTYLHSATMVKAGIYLMARLSPILGGTPQWQAWLGLAGGATMLVAAWMTLSQTDLKRLLAYTTLGVLGTLTFLLGMGGEAAAVAMVGFLLAHALYKATLFLVAGIVDHETGVREVTALSGLRRAMPFTFAAAAAAGLSMAGLPPLLGFVGKELLYEAGMHAGSGAAIKLIIALVSNVSFVLVGFGVGLRPFIGRERPTPKHAHDAPWSMRLGPLCLAGLGLLLGLLPGGMGHELVGPAAACISGQQVEIHLALWHGLTWALGLSVLTWALGAGVYFAWDRMRPGVQGVAERLNPFGPERGYDLWLAGLNWVAKSQTVFLQSGSLRRYMRIILWTTVVLVFLPLLRDGFPYMNLQMDEVRVWEALMAVLMIGGAVAVLRARSRLVAVITLGVVGYAVAMTFVFFSAPDLAITQFSIETLSVILFVLVLYKLPRFSILTQRRARMRDALTALASGAMITTLMLLAMTNRGGTPLKDYFALTSYAKAHGHNIVNVILVDFRGFDTMGEITVLSIAAIGVFALMKLKLDRDKNPGKENQ